MSLKPHKVICRKRVTFLYRPKTPAASATAADNDVKKARFKATQGRVADPEAAQARIVSAHGYARSTRDMLDAADNQPCNPSSHHTQHTGPRP